MSKRCENFEPLLSAWVDGELGRADRARLGAHLQRCARCRAEIHSLRVTQTMLRSMPVRALGTGVGPVPAGARRRVTPAAVGRVALRSSLVAMLLAVIVGAAGFVAGSKPEGPPRVAVPVDVYVADHLVRAVGGAVSTPALVDGRRTP